MSSLHWSDNLHTTLFSPRDYQVELLAAAFERNTIICLGRKSAKEFIALKLLQELGRKARYSHSIIGVYLSCNQAPTLYTMLKNLTDFRVYQETNDFVVLPKNYNIYILHPGTFLTLLRNDVLQMSDICVLIVEDCHCDAVVSDVLSIFHEFYDLKQAGAMPKVLGLAGPLHSAACALGELEAMLNALEKFLHSKTETASDIVTVLRYCAKPHEFIMQCASYQPDELSALIQDIISTRKTFLDDHRYDPSEIYNTDEFLEELKDIPDPKQEPIKFLNIISNVLNEMGPWCADRVALHLYQRIEKQKIKTPHERHYILLCFVNTTLLQIHTICEQYFRNYKNNNFEMIAEYSSPKVLRLLEILRLFKPAESTGQHDNLKTMTTDLEKMDFQKLSRLLENKCHTVEQTVQMQQLQSRSIIENLDSIAKPDNRTTNENPMNFNNNNNFNSNCNTSRKLTYETDKQKTANTNINRRINNNRNIYSRTRRRTFPRRNRDSNDTAENLWAIIFCSCNFTARVLFDLLAEMSRCDPNLQFLKCQYTTDRIADPLTEPKEAEVEHRRQEEILKRFRSHECNVLIATSVLEEGIDIPKCNLVIRWDPPTTYRSYVQCKGRARSIPAYHVILVAASNEPSKITTSNPKSENLSKRSHYMLCKSVINPENPLDDTDSSDHENEQTQENGLPSKYSLTYNSAKGKVKILNPEVITTKPPIQVKNSEVVLKEINEEPAAIKNVEIETPEEFTQLEIIPPPQLSNENDKNIFTVNNILNASLIDEHKDYKLYDLSKAIDCLKKECEEPNAITVTKSTESTTKIKTFNCCYQTAENFLNDSNNGYLQDDALQAMEIRTKDIVHQMAQYMQIEKILLSHCANVEPLDEDHYAAEALNNCINSYKPLAHLLTGSSVDLSNSIVLVNKYCARLPSDSFTRLTPLWRCSYTFRHNIKMYQYTLRLPINSPLKYDIIGLPMPTQVLARGIAALRACIELHKCGELDNQLQPIGKENFKALDMDWENFELDEQDEKIVQENIEPRPGTTKRRQYYFKRIANEFCNCRPVAGQPCYLYLLDLQLQCPIPDEQNTRGRKIYPPEEARQGFGILTLKKIPKVSSFPIFTRSGEVKVSLILHNERIILNDEQINNINIFINYTFTKVLRLKKFLMLFDPESTENCIFIVPIVKNADASKHIDWSFLDLIRKNADVMPTAVPEEIRHNIEFDAEKFKDAVVMPWYRNQDQPHYFYVAEICQKLSPQSTFPSKKYLTFMHYYYLKYGLRIHGKQPLLDVDHTSARLNFLTPRYVNRKGVALPTSSEATKRAKRENLELKQILVPELCTIHPFPASLWRTAVCLPCILYRINALLLADDIRKKVVYDLGLGQMELPEDKEWPMLDFGWSLADVFNKSKRSKSPQCVVEECIKDEEAENHFKDESGYTDMKYDALHTNPIHSKKKKFENRTLNEIVEDAEHKLSQEVNGTFIEIGTWSNDMASTIECLQQDDEDNDEKIVNDCESDLLNGVLPSAIQFCSKSVRSASPTFIDIDLKKSNEWQDSEYSEDSEESEDSFIESSFSSYDEDEATDVDDIEFTSKNEAENIETEQDVEKFKRQLSIIHATKENERCYQKTKNLLIGYNFDHLKNDITTERQSSVECFENSIKQFILNIESNGMLIASNETMKLPLKQTNHNCSSPYNNGIDNKLLSLLPYMEGVESLNDNTDKQEEAIQRRDFKEETLLSLDLLEKLNMKWLDTHADEIYTIHGCGDEFDNFSDRHQIVSNGNGDKQIRLQFDKQGHEYAANSVEAKQQLSNNCYIKEPVPNVENCFSFDAEPDLSVHPGPSPSVILQALTMSNANDGINLERLETIGDSFLKYAITTYLYITYENVHEGKLSHLRSKQVANLNLYRLGRRKQLGEYMIATKFEPSDNWLPPCYYVPKELEKALIEAKIPPHYWKLVDLVNIKKLSNEEICELVRQKAEEWGLNSTESSDDATAESYQNIHEWNDCIDVPTDFTCFIPYNLVSQHSIPDKSVADCVEALIGAYLIECGFRGALLFMAWLGVRVLPFERIPYNPNVPRKPGSTLPDENNMITVYGSWPEPKSPLLRYIPNAEAALEDLLIGYDEFEKTLGYKFRDRSYLLQAMTHASYTPNRLTDCYQRLEFLGDAVLDYLITRHLYEDPRQHSPGALTDLRSALVNNTIFASLAVRHGFHKYFRHLSPGLNEVIDRFVRIQNENGHSICEEYYLLSEEECDDAEDVEVPKALGDVFESVAGAIFLDSNMCLDEVWRVYSNMMRPEIEQFSNFVPKSPIRELLELEPETAKFGKPEKLADGRRVRVTVEVFCKGTYRGIGRNYRIAKCTAAKCALRQLKKKGLIGKKIY